MIDPIRASEEVLDKCSCFIKIEEVELNTCDCDYLNLQNELTDYFYEEILKKKLITYENKTEINEKCSMRNIACYRERNSENVPDIGGHEIVEDKETKPEEKPEKIIAPKRRSYKNLKSANKVGNLASIQEAKTTEVLSEAAAFNTLTVLDKIRNFSSEDLNWMVRRDEKNARIVFQNGSMYEGEVENKLPQGKGTFNWVDGCIYKGEFHKGFPTGMGEMVLPDLSQYSGSFYKGYFHGHGVFNVKNTNIMYKGEWKYGKKHGNGWLLYEPDVWYEGSFENDLLNGNGFFNYKDGSCYEGEFVDNKREGKGAMRWQNNDVYIGEWSKGLLHGEGEYAWNVSDTNSLCFPVHHYYKGSWLNGKRSGEGVMFFGNENGAKMEGVFKDNFKHGAAIVVCGNGQNVGRNPLFLNDKPVHIKSDDIDKESYFTETRSTPSYRNMLKNSAMKIKETSSEYRMSMSGKGKASALAKSSLIQGKDDDQMCNPIEIQIHSPPEDIDLTYYIEQALTMYANAFDSIQFDFDSYCSSTSDTSKVPPSKWNLMTLTSGGMTSRAANKFPPVYVEFMPRASSDPSHASHYHINKSDAKFQTTMRTEEKYLRNVILRHLPKLMNVYYHYATITTAEMVYYKHFLCRMFLWQIYLDIGITHMGISLVEIDKLLEENPSSFVQTTHNPFEHIYFFQFIQSLVGVSLLIHSKNMEEMRSNEGLTPFIFQKFLIEHLFPKAGSHKGRCLFEFKDVLPIKSVYGLYLQLGEPHSARTFLKATCTKKGETPPCYKSWNVNVNSVSRNKSFVGKNINTIGFNLMYIPVEPEMGEVPNTPVSSPIPESDHFYQDLSMFRILGPKTILCCLANICPPIRKGEIICNIDYPMTFLEFYEVLILCTILLLAKRQRQSDYLDDKLSNKEIGNLEEMTDSDNKELSIKERKTSQKFKGKKK